MASSNMYSTDSTGSLILKENDVDFTSDRYANLVKFENMFCNSDDSYSLNIRRIFISGVKKRFSKCSIKKIVLTHFPIIQTILMYDLKEYFLNDLIAGLISGIMMIPQGMAFAALSTLPPIVGLYISFFASVTYFVMGTGRQISWGCIAIFSLMMANILDKYDSSFSSDSKLLCVNGSVTEFEEQFVFNLSTVGNESNSNSNSVIGDDLMVRRLEVASGVTVIVGIILTIASRIGLSRISAVMSDSFITGFSVGVSFHIATSQLKTLFGISVPRYKGPGQLIRTWIVLVQHFHETNASTLITSLICMLVIYLVKRHINERFKSRMRVPIPIELFVVIAATLASYFGHLNQNHDVNIVGEVPIGVPAPKLPDLSLVTDYIGDALVIILVAYAQSLAMAKTMGLKNNYAIDAPQEMLACGLCNIVCGLFSGYITGASVSRSIVQEGAGGKTQFASLIAAFLVLLVIMVLGPYFFYLPKCVLSAIIVINLRSMFLKILDIPKEWKKSKYDCAIWVFSALAIIFLNADVGLLAGIVFSIFLVIVRSMIQPIEEAGQIQTSNLTVQLRSLSKYSSAQKVKNVKILRVKTPLYFINSEVFLNAVLKQINMKEFRSNNCDMGGYSNNCKRDGGDGIVTNENYGVMKAMGVNENANGENDENLSLLKTKVVILDMSEVPFIDLMGVKALEVLMKQSSKADVVLLFTNISESIFSMLKSTGFWKKYDECLFLTVEAALTSLAGAVLAEKEENTKL